MFPKNKSTLSNSLMPSRRLASDEERPVFGTVVLMPNGITVTLSPATPNDEQSAHSSFALCGQKCGRSADIESSAKAGFADESFASRLPAFTLWAVKYDPFAQQSVIEHQHRAIEEFEFVVPQDVEDFRLRRRRVANQPPVISQDPSVFGD